MNTALASPPSLAASGSGLPGLGLVGTWLNDPDNWRGPGGLAELAGQHLAYTALIVAAAAVIAVPAGIWIGHTGKGTALAGGTANALRAVPALGLLILLIVELAPRIHVGGGAGWLLAPGAVPYFVPAAIVLVILAVPPILTGTYAGIQALDPGIGDAARGAGMSSLQVAVRVEAPCALPLILSGVRSATLQVIASLTVAAYAPLVGGLGRLIVDGQQDLTSPRYGYPAMVAAGLAVAVLALAADAAFAAAGRYLPSPGLTGRYQRSAGTPATRGHHPLTPETPAPSLTAWSKS